MRMMWASGAAAPQWTPVSKDASGKLSIQAGQVYRVNVVLKGAAYDISNTGNVASIIQKASPYYQGSFSNVTVYAKGDTRPSDWPPVPSTSDPDYFIQATPSTTQALAPDIDLGVKGAVHVCAAYQFQSGGEPAPLPPPGDVKLTAADTGKSIALQPGQSLSVTMPPALPNTFWGDEGGYPPPCGVQVPCPVPGGKGFSYPTNGPLLKSVVNPMGTVLPSGQVVFGYAANVNGGPVDVVLTLRDDRTGAVMSWFHVQVTTTAPQPHQQPPPPQPPTPTTGGTSKGGMIALGLGVAAAVAAVVFIGRK
jgi:hypothetical protein